MEVYLDVVMLLNFLVDLLLLLGTNRLTGYPPRMGRAAAAAAIGGLYGGVCLLPGFSFMGSTLWRMVVLVIMSAAAFGLHTSALRRCVLFVFLCMALGGISTGFGPGQFVVLVLCAAGVWLMCVFAFRGRADGRQYVPVSICCGGRQASLLALVDTGNTLTDPISGEQVIVVGSQIGERLLGLNRQQLASPVETVLASPVPGLRLLPYRAVGCDSGMLLAAAMDEVYIDNRPCGRLVAFSPDPIGQGHSFQALTGGTL